MLDWVRIKQEHITAEFTDAQVGSLVRFQLLVARLNRHPTDKELYRETSRKTVSKLKEVLSMFGTDLEIIAIKVLEDVEKIQRRKKVSQESSSNLRLKSSDGDGHVTALDKRREEKRREDKNIKKIIKKKKFIKPSLDDVKKHIEDNGFTTDAETWYSWNESNGWKVGKNDMKCWKAALSYWEKTSTKFKEPIVFADPDYENAFTSLWDAFPPSRKGVEWEAREMFKACVNQSDLAAVKKALESYTKTDDVKNDVIMKFTRWVECWRNYT